MKRKYVVALLMAMSMTMVLSGCKNSSDENKVEQKQENVTENASIDLITNWEEQATVTLGEKIKISGNGVELSNHILHITKGGAYTISGESENVAILVDCEEDVKIILNDVTMTNPSGPVIYGNQSNSLYVETVEGTENVLNDGSAYETDEEGNSVGKATICSNDDLILLGSGSLEVNGNFKHCIAGDDNVYFEGGSYVLKTEQKDGVHANDLICVDAGTFEIEAASDCMESEADLIVNHGTISGNSADEGIEAKNALSVIGGSIDLTTKDDGLNAGTSISISGGDVKLQTTGGDAIDSNGSMEISGGTVTVYGGVAPEGALDCDNAKILLNGGTVIAVGDANSEISEESTQISVLLGQYEKGQKISIVTEAGEEVVAFTLEEARSNIVVSSSLFEKDKIYKVIVDGSEERSFTVESMIVSAGGTASVMGGGPQAGEGQMPSDGQMAENGQRPGKGQMPEEKEMPDGMKAPSEGNFPGDMDKMPEANDL